MAIQAIVRDVELSAFKPAAPLRSPGIIENAIVGPKPLNPDLFFQRTPEFHPVFPRPGEELLAIIESESVHKSPDVCLLNPLACRFPDPHRGDCLAHDAWPSRFYLALLYLAFVGRVSPALYRDSIQ